MTITSPLSTAANNIVKIGTRSEKALPKAQKDFQDFSKFLQIEIVKLQKQELPDKRKIKKLANLNIADNFGSIGNLLKGLFGGAFNLGGFLTGMFPEKGEKVGSTPGKSKTKRNPSIRAGKLRIGGLKSIGIVNSIFAGLDFATGLAEGESVGKSAAGAGGSLAGSLLGGAIGQTLIPVPGLGFVIGSAVGGFIGGYGADRVYETFSSEGKQEQRLKEQERKQKELAKENKVEGQSFSEVLMKFNQAVMKFESFIVSGVGKFMGVADNGKDLNQEYGEYPDRDTGDFVGGDMPNLEAEGGITPSGKITSRYRTKDRPNHMGVDYGMPNGTPISVIQPGRITRAGWFDGYGYGVQVNHPGGVNSFYGHLSEINVKVGDNIQPGTVIGKVGSTGRSTGPHLHFEIDANGKSKVDPTSYADKIFRFGGNVKAREVQKPPTNQQQSSQTLIQTQSQTLQQQSQTKPQTPTTPQIASQQTQTAQKPITQPLPQNVIIPLQIQQRQIETYPSYSQSQSYILEKQTIIAAGGQGSRSSGPTFIPTGGGSGGQSISIIPQTGSAVLNSLMKNILLTTLSST